MTRAGLVVLISLALGLGARGAAAKCEDGPEVDADPANGGHVAVTLSQHLPTRAKVTLLGTDGQTVMHTFENSAGVHWLTVPVAQKYKVVVEVFKGDVGEQVLFGYACFDSAAKLWALGYTDNPAKDVDPAKAFAKLTIQQRTRTSAPTAIAALDLSGSAGPSIDAVGNRSRVPDALQQTLQILAEIALDRAKAEALRLFHDKLVATVCDGLTIGRVFRNHVSTDISGDRLLPSLCGQLENLRLGDLGASANGLLVALREDLASIVVPTLVSMVAGRADPGLVRLLSTLVSRATSGSFNSDEVKLALIAFLKEQKEPLLQKGNTSGPIAEALVAELFEVALACLQGCTGDDFIKQLRQRLPVEKLFGKLLVRFVAIDGIAAIADTNLVAKLKALLIDPDKMVAAGEAAIKEVLEQRTDPVTALISALTTQLGLPPAEVTALEAAKLDKSIREWLRFPTLKPADVLIDRIRGLETALPELAAIVGRMRQVLNPSSGLQPLQQARDVASVVLDVMAVVGCGSDLACRAATNEVKDIIEGALDGDYLRALGGLTAALQRSKLGAKHRRAFMLIASIMSYVDTYKKTKDQDAKDAHDARRKALEALIDAGTDRSNRDAGLVVSVGANIGLLGGVRRLPYMAGTGTLFDGTITADSFSFASDLQLSMGLTFLWLKDSQKWQGFMSASFIDLGQFAPTDGPGTSSELQWSDFVHIGGTIGLAFNHRVPFVIGLQASWAPTLRFEYETSAPDPADPTMTLTTSKSTEGVFRAGVFAGFSVPFLDLD